MGFDSGQGHRFCASPRRESGQSRKLTTYLHLMLFLKCVELYLHCPIHLMVWCLINDRYNVTLAWVVCKSQSLVCSPSVARTRKFWKTDCQGFWSFWTLASYLGVLSVHRASHHTSGTFNFEVTFTWGSVHGWRIRVRLHVEHTLRLFYAATFNRTWTVLLFTCRGEETVLCCVRWEGHTAFNCQCFLGCVGFFSVHLTSVSRLSEFAVRKCFELKLRSRINPYFMSFFHKSYEFSKQLHEM